MVIDAAHDDSDIAALFSNNPVSRDNILGHFSSHNMTTNVLFSVSFHPAVFALPLNFETPQA